MKRLLISSLIAFGSALLFSSCAEPERKVVGPTSNTSRIPWNKPIPGQGGGQFGMLEQSRYRR